MATLTIWVLFALCTLVAQTSLVGYIFPLKLKQNYQEEVVVAQEKQEEEPDEGISPNRGYLSHLENKGIGFNTGYSTAGLFLGQTNYLDQAFEFFFDGRVHVFNDGNAACNIGFGERYKSLSLRKVFGINAYYDYRHDLGSFNQLGLGLEMLSCNYDLRVNGYLPVGKTSNHGKSHRFDFVGGFVAICQKHQRALPGIDAEVSTSLRNWLPKSKWDFTGGLGPYFFHRICGDNIYGGRLRLNVQYQGYLNLEMRTTYDPVFKTIVQGIFSFSFPLFKRSTFHAKESCSEDRLREITLQPVQRNEIIATKKNCAWRTNF